MDQPQPMLADAFKMSVEGETVVIEFGRGAGLGPAGQPNVAVTDRIVIPSGIAQRLMMQLDDALKPHAAALRLAQAQALPPGQAAVAARPGPAAPARPPADESGTRAAQLIRLVGELGVPHQYERSFRISVPKWRASSGSPATDWPPFAAWASAASCLALDRRLSAPCLNVCEILSLPWYRSSSACRV